MGLMRDSAAPESILGIHAQLYINEGGIMAGGQHRFKKAIHAVRMQCDRAPSTPGEDSRVLDAEGYRSASGKFSRLVRNLVYVL